MTKPDQRKLRVLILLLIALGLTVFISSRLSRRPNPEVVQAENQKTAAVSPSQNDARIRLDLLDRESGGKDLGKKNLFQYPPPPPPPAPTASAAPPATGQPPAPSV